MEAQSRRSWLILAGFIAACYGVSAIGSLWTLPEIPGWYAGLAKPGFNPPNWVFGPVWTLLYGLMAVAAWQVWKRPTEGSGRRAALALFWVQLGLNLLWTLVFFHEHQIALALGAICVLWLAVLLTMAMFWRVRRSAGVLMLPYLLWVSFATALNAGIARLN